MSVIALFHPSFGITPGIRDAEKRLKEAGHIVHVIDYYGGGQTFTNYDEADKFVNEIGFPKLMQNAIDAVKSLEDGFIAMGFSNGSGMATFIALNRKVSAAVLCSGALPLALLGADAWPEEVPAQLHYMLDDPRKMKGSVESVMESINKANADAQYVQYPGSAHLFTDPSLADEYDVAATERFWTNVLQYIAIVG